MILFDLMSAQPIGSTKFHGGGEYIKAVFKDLVESLDDESVIAVCYDFDCFLDEWVIELIERKGIEKHAVKNWAEIRCLLATGLFCAFFSGLPRYIDKASTGFDFTYIGVIHGLRPIEKPFDRYAFRMTRGANKKLRLMVKAAFKSVVATEYEKRISALDVVITDSYHSKYSIDNVFHFPCAEVIYPPNKAIVHYASSVVEPSREKFILVISSNRWEKNPYRAALAIDDLFDRGHLPQYKAVFIGCEDNSILKMINNPDRFETKGYVRVGELEDLYSKCDVFFYPTLNEGFGYPPLEAMRHGTTCVVSGVCSLQEVCGDAVYYVNPYDIMEMQTRLLQASEEKVDSSKITAQSNRVLLKQQEGITRLRKLLLDYARE